MCAKKSCPRSFVGLDFHENPSVILDPAGRNVCKFFVNRVRSHIHYYIVSSGYGRVKYFCQSAAARDMYGLGLAHERLSPHTTNWITRRHSETDLMRERSYLHTEKKHVHTTAGPIVVIQIPVMAAINYY